MEAFSGVARPKVEKEETPQPEDIPTITTMELPQQKMTKPHK